MEQVDIFNNEPEWKRKIGRLKNRFIYWWRWNIEFSRNERKVINDAVKSSLQGTDCIKIEGDWIIGRLED